MVDVNEADMDHKRSFRLFRVRRTLLKMLRNRNYLVLEQELSASYDDFKERFQYPTDKGQLFLQVTGKDDPSDVLHVYFPPEDKVDVKQISVYADQMKKENVHRAILVVGKDVSPFARKALLAAQPRYFVEIFKESELLVDITEHELVPKHEVLSSDEKATLMAKYKLNDSQLPRMYTTDPITRYFGLQRGQVVKIIRSSETAGRYVTYRIVH